jgi:hypothetical protein
MPTGTKIKWFALCSWTAFSPPAPHPHCGPSKPRTAERCGALRFWRSSRLASAAIGRAADAFLTVFYQSRFGWPGPQVGFFVWCWARGALPTTDLSSGPVRSPRHRPPDVSSRCGVGGGRWNFRRLIVIHPSASCSQRARSSSLDTNRACSAHRRARS